MGDSESLVVKTSTVMDYTSTVMDYTSTVEISGLGSNLVPNDEALANVEVAGGGVASVVAIAVEGNDVDGNTVMQEAPVVAGESDDANAVVDSAQVVGYDASVNGNGVAVVGEYNVAGNDTNGNADASEVVIEQFEGDHDLSTEEGRLWSIVRANSLDFSAWTALIEETEKVAEGICIIMFFCIHGSCGM
ncbi:hypothetical protein GIB67_009077 [Kingdonia uniflora]|uniref:Uncharacterized protein n=1 Tax=Kingdonia uniflora TaxID=39325 RepID=A0A7J7MN95_9MAGN|nr:hypothetical protein GIB67_009077 [Kingdonia uniflora]